MRIVRTKAELRAELEPARRAGRSIGLVPTMGALHAGHLSLLAGGPRALRRRGHEPVRQPDPVPPRRGPRRLPARRGSATPSSPTDAGVDLVYAPGADEVYPPGFATAVEVGGPLTAVLDGDPERRGSEHFRGVTTVVAKLFNSVGPDLAFFGQKDAQQAVVIRRMARDLDFPVEIVVMPTVREPDGLALSSRNAYLKPDERERAAALSRALRAAERPSPAARPRPTPRWPPLAPSSRRRASSSSTWRRATPRRSPRRGASTGGRC